VSRRAARSRSVQRSRRSCGAWPGWRPMARRLGGRMSRIARDLSRLAALALLSPVAARAGAPLETETARLAPRGTLQAEVVLEVQTSSDGRESALPLAFEYALRDRLEILAEPVPYTSIRPARGAAAQGPGDIEVTLNALAMPETGRRPAIAF